MCLCLTGVTKSCFWLVDSRSKGFWLVSFFYTATRLWRATLPPFTPSLSLTDQCTNGSLLQAPVAFALNCRAVMTTFIKDQKEYGIHLFEKFWLLRFFVVSTLTWATLLGQYYCRIELIISNLQIFNEFSLQSIANSRIPELQEKKLNDLVT